MLCQVFESMTKKELQQWCRDQGLYAGGNREEVLARIYEAMGAGGFDVESDGGLATGAPDASVSSQRTARCPNLRAGWSWAHTVTPHAAMPQHTLTLLLNAADAVQHFYSYSKKELKEWCDKHGLYPGGNKDEVLDRIFAAFRVGARLWVPHLNIANKTVAARIISADLCVWCEGLR